MIDYMTLKLIWWGIISFLIIAFAITGGLDLGVNCLLPVIGHDDDERRLILNSTGPTWEGNQVWLVTLGAGLFAIWPIAYATVFSSMYFAFMLVLLMLILRPPGIDYRRKIDSHAWRKMWDIALFGGSIILALTFGVAIGNLFTGMPFYFNDEMQVIYQGTFISLFSPCALLFGIVSLCMMVFQGALFLQYKLSNQLEQRAKRMAKVFGFAYIASFVCCGLYVGLTVTGFEIVQIPDINTSFAVANKVVQPVSGWLGNYADHKILWLLPIIALISARVAIKLSEKNHPVIALFINSIGITSAVLTAGTSIFPFVLPSNSTPNHSLTIWDVSSSALTLQWALAAVVVLLPIVLLYTIWVYRVMRGKVKISPDSY